MKRLFTLFAYRLPYRAHKRNLYILYGILLAVVSFTALFIILAAGSEDPHGLAVTAFVFFILTVISIITVIIYLRIVAAAKADYEMIKEYFAEETYIYNEALIRGMTNRALRDRNAKVLVAVLVVRGISNIRNTFGQQGIKIINTSLKNSIRETVEINESYAFGFSPIKGFIVYKRTNDTDTFVEEIRSICDKLNKQLEATGTLPDVAVLTGITVGENGSSYDELFEKASTASTYNLSTRVVSDTIIYNDELMTDNEGERVLSTELGNAINEEQLQVYYQPKFDLKTNKFYGAEALIRWNHPSRGLLPPSLFIPFAEQSNRIIDIDMYVFEHVCRDIVKWRNEGKRILVISINLSRKTALDPQILTFYKDTMERYDINPKWIDIELTESMAAQDSLFVSSIIRKVKAMNMDTSIDDFGTGYSSFSSLKKIPFDTLKIDKSFMDEVELDKKSRDLVRCINDIGHSLGMKTLAEGIETESQVAISKELGIDGIQGYYFSRPLSEFEYQRFLANNEFEHNTKKGVKA